jgi:hypothetical protein
MKNIYVVMAAVETEEETFPPAAIGLFTSMKRADEYIDELEKSDYWSSSVKSVVYHVEKHEVNKGMITKHSKPLFSQDDLEHEIEELIKRGSVEALIGEDGNFYYQLTEQGQKELEDGMEL